MDVKNGTRGLDVRLARGVLDATWGGAVIVVEARYAIVDGTTRPMPDVGRRADDPPRADRLAWSGTSLTVVGDVTDGRARERSVSLDAPGVRERLVVRGDRRWLRARGGWRASEPALLGVVPLAFERAFGGTYREGPGVVDGRHHLGFEVRYPANPHGRGFVRAAEAEGALLPNVERLGFEVRCPSDHPEPAAFAPCPDLAALRAGAASGAADFLTAALRMAHHAPGRLVTRLGADDVIVVAGLVERPVRLVVPPPPTAVRAERRGRGRELTARLRAVHLDLRRRELLATWGHGIVHRRADPPATFAVRPSPEAGR